jgi:hypothetical protein
MVVVLVVLLGVGPVVSIVVMVVLVGAHGGLPPLSRDKRTVAIRQRYIAEGGLSKVFGKEDRGYG